METDLVARNVEQVTGARKPHTEMRYNKVKESQLHVPVFQRVSDICSTWVVALSKRWFYKEWSIVSHPKKKKKTQSRQGWTHHEKEMKDAWANRWVDRIHSECSKWAVLQESTWLDWYENPLGNLYPIWVKCNREIVEISVRCRVWKWLLQDIMRFVCPDEACSWITRPKHIVIDMESSKCLIIDFAVPAI